MNNISKIENKIISINDTIVSALKQMDGHRTKLVFVFDGDKFECILTIGDIQRAIIRQANLSDPISTILDRDKIYVSDKDSIEHIKDVMFKELIDCMPVLNDAGEIVDVLFWHDVFTEAVADNRAKIDLPVVIMAGGLVSNLLPMSFQNLLFQLVIRPYLRSSWISSRVLDARSSTCLSTTRPI